MNIRTENIPFSPPDITEEEINAVTETLRSGWITTGPKTKELENRIARYVEQERAVCLNSATAAMETTLRILGVGPGDEVITSAYTYTATASVIDHVGAKIVLIDTAPNSYEMDYKQLKEAINKNTKVVIPVDIAGVMCDYRKIFEVVKSKKELFEPSNDIQESFNRVVILSDAAHAFGARRDGEKAGKVADFTCFSFHAVKNLTTGEGGAVVWNEIEGYSNESIYNLYMLYSLHGQTKDALSKSQRGSWEYDIILPAYKCNMTDIVASIGLVQLERYENMLNRRSEIINKYDDAFLNTEVTPLSHFSNKHTSAGHLYLVNIPSITEKRRNELVYEMSELGVSCNVHYKPLPMLTAYKNLGFNIKDYPNAYIQYSTEISLPLHTSLSNDDVDYIIAVFKKVLSN
ncbi:DegT/DnrJ/EryC1/StrS family aminotransferase [Salinicoccus sesuvii]|uniref:DegT/DnrJ/EryC1/StrS family aminotransferase n=1 Tax=Salinicoccus sesuvii TaxID=868281 RepID=A0ABV7N951_9STAP